MTKSSKAITVFVIGAAVGALVGYYLKTDELAVRKQIKKEAKKA